MGLLEEHSFSVVPQLESLLHLWLTLSLNSYSCGAEDSGGDIFLFNSGRVPTIPINQGQPSFRASPALLSSPVCLSLLVLVFSVHLQLPHSVVMVPQHIPENVVPGAALSHSDDQHASQWSVCFCSTSNLFSSQKVCRGNTKFSISEKCNIVQKPWGRGRQLIHPNPFNGAPTLSIHSSHPQTCVHTAQSFPTQVPSEERLGGLLVRLDDAPLFSLPLIGPVHFLGY